MFLLFLKRMRNGVGRRSAINLSSRIIISAVSLVFLGIVSRKLSEEQLGIFAVLFVFYGIVSMFGGLGFGTSSIRLIPETKAKGNLSHVSDIIKYTVFVPFGILLCLMVAGFYFQKDLSDIFLKSPDLAGLIRLILISSVFYATYDRIILIMQSLQWFSKIAVLNITINILQRSLAIIFLYFGCGVKGILCGFLIGNILGCILGLILLLKYLLMPFSGYSLKQYIRFSLPFYGQGFSRFMFSRADQTFIAILFTPDKLAVYFIAKRIVSLINLVLEPLLEPMIPKLSEIKARGLSAFRENSAKIYIIFSFLAFGCACFVIFNSRIALFIVGGAKYAANTLILNILAVSVFLSFIFSVSKIGIYLYQHPKETFRISFYVGLINTSLGIVMGLYLGLAGFALAQCIGFLWGVFFIRHKYKSDWVIYEPKLDALYFLSFSAVVIIGGAANRYLLQANMDIANIIRIFALNLGLAVVFLALVFKSRIISDAFK
ncbi:MAG: oligosaccharide flippase family protein [Candidatus Aureabacteria bacterium]|nr:oligosaccharide flippase family protein [Candidatus Auribacterota bacterium]